MPEKKVTLPLRREWLQKCDEGASPKAIANEYRVDVRTVKKHLELAEEERNRREATAALMRNALERHQGDLIGVVETIKRLIPLYPEYPGAVGVDYETQISESRPLQYKLLLALRKEHIPRASLWRELGKWVELRDSYLQADREARRDDAEALQDRLLRQGELVHDELDTILLRRVVPGRCRYCPV
ncbi:MAG: hypothetical protein WBF66_07315 [Dehalococcoidia bacterium]